MPASLAPGDLQQKWCLSRLPDFAHFLNWLIPHGKPAFSVDLDTQKPPSMEDGALDVYKIDEAEAGRSKSLKESAEEFPKGKAWREHTTSVIPAYQTLLG